MVSQVGRTVCAALRGVEWRIGEGGLGSAEEAKLNPGSQGHVRNDWPGCYRGLGKKKGRDLFARCLDSRGSRASIAFFLSFFLLVNML